MLVLKTFFSESHIEICLGGKQSDLKIRHVLSLRTVNGKKLYNIERQFNGALCDNLHD